MKAGSAPQHPCPPRQPADWSAAPTSCTALVRATASRPRPTLLPRAPMGVTEAPYAPPVVTTSTWTSSPGSTRFWQAQAAARCATWAGRGSGGALHCHCGRSAGRGRAAQRGKATRCSQLAPMGTQKQVPCAHLGGITSQHKHPAAAHCRCKCLAGRAAGCCGPASRSPVGCDRQGLTKLEMTGFHRKPPGAPLASMAARPRFSS